MADNVAVTAGSGTSIATDDVSGVQYQRVKISDGTPDSSTHLKVCAEDAAHSSGDTGIMALAVRQDSAAQLAGTDGDYTPLITDASGRLHVVATAATSSNVVDDAAFTPASSQVSMVGFTADEAATDSVDEGDGGAARMTLDRKQIVTLYPHTAGGCAIFRSLDLDESEEDVKTSAGQVYGLWFTNTAADTRWLKFYNATAANVSVGTTTPVLTVGLPGNSTDDITGLFSNGGMGIAFDTAICVAATTGVADNDTGAPSANDVVINIFYK